MLSFHLHYDLATVVSLQISVQLTTMLLHNTGRVIYPCYDIIREKQIFRDKNDLCQFEKSISFESRISEVIDSKQFENVSPTFEEANLFFVEIYIKISC